MTTASPTSVPKINWSQRMASILASTIALPLIFEILLALLGDEPFNFGRAAVAVVIVGLTAGGLYIARPGWLNVQRPAAHSSSSPDSAAPSTASSSPPPTICSKATSCKTSSACSPCCSASPPSPSDASTSASKTSRK
ncbi:hypothetical protein ACFQZ4_46065 [Catellatospora coxensis]